MNKTKIDYALSLLNMIILLQQISQEKNINTYYIDLFCGAGGTSTGVELATINGRRIAKVIACVNHDRNAIASHMANHPEALHFTEDIRILNLARIISLVKKIRQMNPNAVIVLWASLECTNFSKAKGGQPRDADSRTLADHLFRYIDAIKPDYIQIENVEEFMSWGEMDTAGKPISKDKGVSYMNWITTVKKRGYDYDYRVLNAADYGAYTSRRRFFGIFARTGYPIVWPEATHSKAGSKDMFSELKKWMPVRDVLNLEDEGESIFDRAKQHVEATLDRVLSGLVKFVAGGKDKWLLKYNSVNKDTRRHVPPSIDEPCPTVSCQSRLGVVQASFLSKHFSGHTDSKNISIENPAHTITAVDHHSLVSASFLAAYYGNGDNVSPVTNPCPVVPTKDRFNLVNPKFLSYETKERIDLARRNFIMNNYTNGGQHSDIGKPCPAVTSVPKQNLVQCRFMDQQFGQSKASSINKPVGAITSNPKYNLVTCKPWVMNTNFGNVGSPIDEPAPVITANRKWHYLMNPQFSSQGGDVNAPCFTLIARMDKRPPYLIEATSNTKDIPSFIKIEGDTIIYEIYEDDTPKMKDIKEFMALYGLIDIKMRMLRIPELKRIMGFPEDYKLIGTQAEQKKYIGNAVEVNMARVICEANVKKLMQINRLPLAA